MASQPATRDRPQVLPSASMRLATFVLGRRGVIEGGVEALLVVPGHPLEDRSLDFTDVLP